MLTLAEQNVEIPFFSYKIVNLLKQNYKFVVFSTLVLLAIFCIENINDRFWLNDFKVYYLAAKSLVAGGPVYGIPFGLGTGFYKYSPAVLPAFVPYGFFSFYSASVIHFIILSIASISSIVIIQLIAGKTIINGSIQGKNLLLSLGFVCILNHLVRELHLGNVNVLIVFLLSLGLLFILQTKQLTAGILIGIALIIKPYLLVLLLPLILHKKIKTIISVVLTILLSFGLMVVIVGFSKSADLHLAWVKSMLDHSSYLSSNHTILSILKYYIYAELPSSLQFYILAFVSALYFFTFYYISKFRDPIISERLENTYLIIGYFALLALIPNLLITDTEHFLFALPLIIILLNYIALNKNKFSIILFILIILFYGSNSSDLFGSKLSDQFETMGLLGMANLGIIIFALSLVLKKSRVNNLLNKT